MKTIPNLFQSAKPVCALVAVFLSVMAPGTSAQAAGAGITNPPVWLRTNATSELVWGGFEFHPSARAGLIFDDNILYAPGKRQTDVIYQLSPGIQIVGGDRTSFKTYVLNDPFVDVAKLSASSLVVTPQEQWPGKIAILNYAPQWQIFDHHSVEDSFDENLTARAILPLSKLVLGFQQDYQDAKSAMIEATNRIWIESIRSAADIGYRLNDDLSVNARAVVQQISYPDSAVFSGFTEYKGQVSVNRQIDGRLTASLFATEARDDVDNSHGQVYTQGGGRLRYELSKLLAADLQVGGEYREFDSGTPDIVRPFFNLEMNYRLRQLTDIRLGAGRNLYASLNQGYYYEHTGAYLNVRRGITGRFAIQGNLSYFNDENRPSTQAISHSFNSDYYSAQIAAEANLASHLNAELYYLFRGDGLLVHYNALRDNQCGLQLKWTF